jgi:hypothetical protein
VQSVSVTIRHVLVAAVLVGMVILSGCIQEKDANNAPESTVPTTVSAIPSVNATVTPSLASTPDAGPVQFVPGGVYHEGDELLITGTTILSPGNPLLIEVASVAFGPSNKTDPAYFSGATAVIEVTNRSFKGQNSWQYMLNTSGFVPGDYSIEITGIEVQNFRKTATFTLLP